MTSKIDLTNISGENKFRENVKKASEFLDSCFDENNEDDDLSFEERVNTRKKELPDEVREIVECATVYHKDDTDMKTPIFEGSKVCENSDCDSSKMSPRSLLALASAYKERYKTKKRELKAEQARLRLETDWSSVIEGKARPSNDDKDAWILLETLPLQEEVDTLEAESQHVMELFKLEKLMLTL